jgi:hypothetical protein
MNANKTVKKKERKEERLKREETGEEETGPKCQVRVLIFFIFLLFPSLSSPPLPECLLCAQRCKQGKPRKTIPTSGVA